MSRPTTRSKNKKQRQDIDVDRHSDILRSNSSLCSKIYDRIYTSLSQSVQSCVLCCCRKIHVSGEITDDDINQLYNIWKPVCQGCRVNNKENPNCFCGLVPSAGGSRKTGLWLKQSEFQQGLGPDPSEDLRSSLNFPSGLTNLGATCYANSILQCLFMNTSFRKGVFSIEDDLLKQQPVLDQLAWLFVQLQASMKAFIDSAPFIKTLELDNGVQQDSHEFLTLLLSLLERCLSNSRSSAAKTIVQDLFRGNVSHVTTCSNCGRDSEASSKIEDFYELELNVMGLKTLAESLDDYLSIEELNGDNQYFCDSCQARVDATRSIKLRSLPDVLNIQLKRCVFLPKTTMKKKITSAFSFPRELDMRKRLSDPVQANLVYDLSAVLIHKGTAVNSGHYIAHIKDENTGQWWEFDDEVVSKLGFHPFGEGSSKSGNKQSQKEAPVTVPSSQLVSNEAKAKVADEQFFESAPLTDHETFSSKDAYMLMYTLRHRKISGQKRTLDSKFDTDFACLSNGTSLPSCLGEKIKELNCSYMGFRSEYNLRKEKEWGHILKRREEVREILSEAPVQSSGELYFWISTNWLRHWADDIFPQILDNQPIQCLHGKVPVSNIVSMKRVSATAWTKLFSKYDGSPALSNSDYCTDCLIDAARNLVCAESYRYRRKFMKEIADSVLSGNCSDGMYYVSKAWLQQWVKRKIMDAPTEADVGPTISICCPHGLLRPEQAAGAKRVLVPENLWLFFYGDYRTVKPGDETSSPTFPIDSKQCSECSDELSEVASLEDSLRAIKNKQRQNHEKLAAGKSIPLFPDCKYYLLPSAWLAKWRNYVLASGSNVSAPMEPDVLDSVIDQLKCEKHRHLLEKPLDLVYKRGAIMQKVSNTDGLTIITENDWKCFCEEWGCNKQNGISAIIEFADITAEDNKGGVSSSKDTPMSVSEDETNSHEGANDKCDDKPPPVIRTSPEVCEECIGERASCQLMQRLNYSNQDIHVALVQGKEVPRSILVASDTTFDPDRRISKRSRKSSYGTAINLKVSGSTSLYQLKMMIWESLGVVKENQIIHKGHLTIEGDDSTTLADYNIFPGDTLWVRDTKVHEHRDIADELSDPTMEMKHSEGGFRGTLLAADFPSQIV